MAQQCCLNDMQPGQTARILELPSAGDIRRRLQDLGLIPDTLVRCMGKSPWGDPSAFLIRGAVIAIRAADGKEIQIAL